jgi:hypothetical protein
VDLYSVLFCEGEAMGQGSVMGRGEDEAMSWLWLHMTQEGGIMRQCTTVGTRVGR